MNCPRTDSPGGDAGASRGVRSEIMHRYLAITALAVALDGCGGHLRPTTELTMVALNP